MKIKFPGASHRLVHVLGAAALLAAAGAAVAADGADPVLRWNEIGQATVAVANPFIQSRGMAMTQLAVLDAVERAAAASADPEMAAAVAARDILVELVPEANAALDSELLGDFGAAPDPRAIEIGRRAAFELLRARADDGGDAEVEHAAGEGPGAWAPTPPDNAPASLPHWGAVRPFVLESGDQFRPAPPSDIESPGYQDDLREVIGVGSDASTERSAEQTDAVRFWIASAVQGWNPIARQAATAAGHSPAENAMTLAMLNAAIADALITCFDAKYAYGGWRPVAAIHAGVGDIEADPEWSPLLPTPAFPGYPSDDACAAGAAQAVLERRFGAEGHDFQLTSPTAPGVVFRYPSFAAISDQIDDARVHGGVQVREDQEAGRELGRQVGELVYEVMARAE